ncbi:MAG TPA: response regulator [Flavisolibacter sp.]|nr:response regulator [Flavisolibacter sp.]
MLPAQYHILMLEDDPDDQNFTYAALQELRTDIPIHFLSRTEDLEAAIAERPPLLILIDYNIQPQNGLDVVTSLKSNPAYRHIPVILLGDTDAPEFVARCYRSGVNTYAIKPSTLEATKARISLFFRYWLEVAELGVPLPSNQTAEQQ